MKTQSRRQRERLEKSGKLPQRASVSLAAITESPRRPRRRGVSDHEDDDDEDEDGEYFPDYSENISPSRAAAAPTKATSRQRQRTVSAFSVVSSEANSPLPGQAHGYDGTVVPVRLHSHGAVAAAKTSSGGTPIFPQSVKLFASTLSDGSGLEPMLPTLPVLSASHQAREPLAPPQPPPDLPPPLFISTSGVPDGGSPPLDVIMPCISAYWTYCHVWSPTVHKLTFEKAFCLSSSRIYGGKPTALLFAIAAIGTRFAELPGVTDRQRRQYAREYCERSKALLLSGYYDGHQDPLPDTHGPPPVSTNRMSRLEAAQTLILIFQFCVSSGLAPRGFILLERLFDVVLELCVDRTRGVLLGSNWRPSTEFEWIFDEMRKRVLASFVAMDVTFAYAAKREPMYDYFQHPFRFASHEFYFDTLSPDIAFDILYNSVDSSRDVDQPYDFKLLLRTRDPTDLAILLRQLVDPVFAQKRSVVSFTMLATAVRYQRIRIRELAVHTNIDPYLLAAKQSNEDPSSPMVSELVYIDNAKALETLEEALVAALPPDLAYAFGEGITAPMFANAGLHFVDERFVHIFILACLSLRYAVVENWCDDDIGVTATLRSDETAGMPLRFFQSPVFLRIVEYSILFVRLVEGQLLYDPELKWNHFALFMATLKIGGLNLATLKLYRQFLSNGGTGEPLEIPRTASRQLQDFTVWEGLEHDVKLLARHLEIMARRFTGYGA